MKKRINKYLLEYFSISIITAIIEFFVSILLFYTKNIPINSKELIVLFIGYNVFALIIIAHIHISSFIYEAFTYMSILMTFGLGIELIKKSDEIAIIYFFIFFLSLSILFRIFIWKYHLEILNAQNTKRKIKIDFSILEDSEEIFYRRIVLRADNKCSDLLCYFKKNYLNQQINENQISYNFYIADKLMYIITNKDKIEYCQNIDFDLGSFPIKKILNSKVEIIMNNNL